MKIETKKVKIKKTKKILTNMARISTDNFKISYFEFFLENRALLKIE